MLRSRLYLGPWAVCCKASNADRRPSRQRPRFSTAFPISTPRCKPTPPPTAAVSLLPPATTAPLSPSLNSRLSATNERAPK